MLVHVSCKSISERKRNLKIACLSCFWWLLRLWCGCHSPTVSWSLALVRSMFHFTTSRIWITTSNFGSFEALISRHQANVYKTGGSNPAALCLRVSMCPSRRQRIPTGIIFGVAGPEASLEITLLPPRRVCLALQPSPAVQTQTWQYEVEIILYTAVNESRQSSYSAQWRLLQGLYRRLNMVSRHTIWTLTQRSYLIAVLRIFSNQTAWELSLEWVLKIHFFGARLIFLVAVKWYIPSNLLCLCRKLIIRTTQSRFILHPCQD